MNAVEAIERRRTVRDFALRPIPRATLERLLAAGWSAPAAGGQRAWRFILVEDAGLRRALADGFRAERTADEIAALVDSWGVADAEERAMYLDALPRQTSMLEGAGALLLPCFRQPEPLLGEKTSLHELNGLVSIWLCIENILVAAAAEGIFGVTRVPSTPKETQNVRRVLGIPDDVEIACYLALGYPGAHARTGRREPPEIAARLGVDRWPIDG